MSRYSKILKKAFASLLFLVLIFVNNHSFAQDGQALYNQNCRSCHKTLVDFTGPALKGARDREPNKDWAYKWVDNVNSMLQTDPYAKALMAKYGSAMQQ